jgi:hypothetical protein
MKIPRTPPTRTDTPVGEPSPWDVLADHINDPGEWVQVIVKQYEAGEAWVAHVTRQALKGEQQE